MPSLAFLPWFAVRESQTIAGLEFTRYEVGGPQSSPAVDSVLRHYVSNGKRPIQRATVVHATDKPLSADLADDDIDRIFQVVEAVKMAGLARRRFFAIGEYQNADGLAAVIQMFPESGSQGAAVTARRRDGSSTRGVQRDAYQVQCPSHVDVNDGDLDGALAQAIVNAVDQGAPGLEESILSFNLANTDSDATREQIELVFTVGAFERLFDCTRGKEDDLAKGLVALLGRFQFATPPKHVLSRLRSRFRQGDIVEMWIRDMFRLRGDFGHGRRHNLYKPTWDTTSHLLLAAFLFPRALLVKLSDLGLYSITTNDQMELCAFPRLASLRNVFSGSYSGRYLWNEVLNRVSLRCAIEAAFEKHRAADGSPSEQPT